MTIIGLLAFIFTAVGGIWVTTLAFRDDSYRGWLCIFLGYIGIFAYAMDNWRKTRIPFLLTLIGLVCTLIWVLN